MTFVLNRRGMLRAGLATALLPGLRRLAFAAPRLPRPGCWCWSTCVAAWMG
ncbi:hypothetical protein ACFQU2_17020 [Siccirubricoccus deserti]